MIEVSSSIFLFGVSESVGGAVFASSSREAKQLIFINSSFSSYSAIAGGAFYVSGMNLTVQNCTFFNNSAKSGDNENSGEGGAVFISASEWETETTFESTKFILNSANISGGGIKWYSSRPNISFEVFENNSAFYGNDVASFSYQLIEASDNKKDIYI